MMLGRLGYDIKGNSVKDLMKTAFECGWSISLLDWLELSHFITGINMFDVRLTIIGKILSVELTRLDRMPKDTVPERCASPFFMKASF